MMLPLRHIVSTINRVTSRYFLALVITGMGSGLLLPDRVADFAVILPYVLALIVFTMGTSCTVDSFKAIILSPKGFLTALFVVFVLMPLIGYLIGLLFYSGDPELFLGHLLMAVTPVAITSVVWTGIAGGNVALSIALVTVATLVSGASIPGLLSLYAGAVVEFDTLALVGNLSKTIVLPALLGLLVRNRLPRATEVSKPYVDLVAKFGMISVLVINGVTLKPVLGRLGWGMGSLILIVAIHVLANFATGLGVSSLVLGRRSPSVSAVMYSSSMRNNAAGLVIATNYFGPVVSLPVIGCMIVQHFWAGVFFRIVGRRREGHREAPSAPPGDSGLH